MANWTTPEYVKNRCAVHSYTLDPAMISPAAIQDAQRGTLLPFFGETMYEAMDADANALYSWDENSSYETGDYVTHQYLNKGSFDVAIYQNLSGGNTGRPDATSGDWVLSGTTFGTASYNSLLDNGLQSALDWAVWLNVLPRLTYQTANAGVMSNTPDGSSNTGREGLEQLTRIARDSMERALEQLADYMDDNVTIYPDWKCKAREHSSGGMVRMYAQKDRLPSYE